ncbi:MAG: bifunctional DNA primase/polymerase [Blastocatellia bacterium]
MTSASVRPENQEANHNGSAPLRVEIDSLIANDAPNSDVALAYARHGFPVFPLCPEKKVPLSGEGGFHKATIDVEQVADWWRRWPNAMPAIPTGPAARRRSR